MFCKPFFTSQIKFGISTILFCLILFTSHTVFATWQQNPKTPQASCFITDKNGSILMIKDKLLGKYDLPGGALNDRKPTNAAKWNTLRKTGFAVNVGAKLGQIESHSIYACSLIKPHDYYIGDKGKKIIVAWANLLADKDGSQPYLIGKDEERLAQYGFPEEVSHFNQWIKKTTPSRFVLLAHGTEMLPAYYQKQHKWLVDIRNWALSFQTIDSAVKYFSNSSMITIPLFFILIMPFFRSYYGYRSILIFSTGFIYLGLASIILNEYLPIPPPYYVDNSFLALGNFTYSFPATEVTIIAFIFSYVLVRLPSKKYLNQKILIAIFGVILVSLATIKTAIYGESYPSTILLSILFAVGYSFLLKSVRNIKLSDRKRAITTLRFWLFTSLVACLVASFTDINHADFIATYCAGLIFSLLIIKIKPSYTRSIRQDMRLTHFISCLFGLFIIFYLSIDMLTDHVSKLHLLLAKMFIVPIWLMIIHPWLFSQFLPKNRNKRHYP